MLKKRKRQMEDNMPAESAILKDKAKRKRLIETKAGVYRLCSKCLPNATQQIVPTMLK